MRKKSASWVSLTAVLFFLTACASPEEKAANYVKNADLLFADGNLTKATLEYKNALQINQNLADAWLGLAKIYQHRQDWRQVFVSLQKIREINPSHVDGRIMLGQVLLASNQLDQALMDAKDLLQMAPDDARSHSLMAAVQFRLGNNDAAEESVDRALKIDANNGEAVLVRARILVLDKKFAAALEILDRAIQANPENVPLYLMKIRTHHDASDAESIKGVYAELIDKFPDNIGFRQALARAYLLEGNIDDAEQVLQQIVKIKPDEVDQKLQLIAFVQQYRSVDAAVELVESYLGSTGDGFELRFKLAELHEKNDRIDHAREIYLAIISDDGLQPNGLKAKNALALLEIRLGDLKNARTLIDEVLTHDKNNENGLLLRAGFKIQAELYDEAIIDLRTVIRDNPNSIKALGLLGQAYYANGARELALESYAKAFQLAPGNRVIANTLAGSYLRRNKIKQADEILRESINRGNDSIDTVKLLTQVKLALGAWDDAEQLAHQLRQTKGEEALSEQVMGVVFRARDQQDRSIDAFKRAHELAPLASQPMVSLVQTYMRGKKIEQAKRFLQAVLADNDKNVTAYMLLGQLSLIEKNTDAAIEYFSQLIAVDPTLNIGYRGLSSVYLGLDDFEKAEQIVMQGLHSSANQAVLQIKLASIYERSRQFDKAIAIYETMLSANSELIVARNNLANLLTDYRGDQQSLDRARQLAAEFKNSKIPQFRDTYAWAAVKTGSNLEEAVVILQQIVKNNNHVGVYHYHLGEAYRKTDDVESAIHHLSEAVALDGLESKSGKKAQQILTLMRQ